MPRGESNVEPSILVLKQVKGISAMLSFILAALVIGAGTQGIYSGRTASLPVKRTSSAFPPR